MSLLPFPLLSISSWWCCCGDLPSHVLLRCLLLCYVGQKEARFELGALPTQGTPGTTMPHVHEGFPWSLVTLPSYLPWKRGFPPVPSAGTDPTCWLGIGCSSCLAPYLQDIAGKRGPLCLASRWEKAGDSGTGHRNRVGSSNGALLCRRLGAVSWHWGAAGAREQQPACVSPW